ncbi:hypothetical protein ACF073_10805 [Streptomyces sp. NPDC015171]|uniref:hypothetical protein n=1 Tax=Streptomyces sp. NPDC015171 TaxID=3364945 RepID=UPI0036FDD860
MAHHHHKSNKQVEGDPDTGHGRGMPRRPDDAELDARTREDQREAGLSTGRREDPDAVYEEERADIDREAARGDLRTGNAPRKDRDPYPPTRYDED